MDNSDGKLSTIEDTPGKSPEDRDDFTISQEAERALIRKFDLQILSLLAVMYLFNSLDKSNLGNAKTAGLEKGLIMERTNDYNILLSIFFSSPRVLPCMMFMFGFMTLMTVTIHNFDRLVAPRWFLGMAESAFFPLVIYYQTQFYRRGELARRLAIFYAASNVAYAFGGLLAFGVFHIQGGTVANWKYLFVIEGPASMAISVISFIFLPRSAPKARFLNEEEKMLAFYRIQVDSSAIVEEPFRLKEAIEVLKYWTSWLILLIEMCLGIPLRSVSLFLPQIVARLGYSTVKTNLYTVAPNITGAVMLLVLAYASDYSRWRFPFIAIGLFFTFCGFVIYASINVQHDLQVAYFACYENCRVLLTSLGVPIANVMGVVSSDIFRDQDAPEYLPALTTTAAFGAMGIVLTLTLGAYMVIDNKRRNKRQGIRVRARDVPTEKLREGPACADFRWLY
ncbi:MAG: hypothetical protein FE78DRAFT_75579 [Acidomyces sp. 'richmondensis']|nr:MAG: hypothetical protein FE78DRAFT_75579 [Acidomyces sp. 'richmondensis']